MLMRGRRTQNGRQAMEPKANTTRRKMTLTGHLAQREARRKASRQTPSPSIMSADKIAELKQLMAEKHAHALIEGDGGVNAETGKALAQAGADMVVSGNYLFKSPDPQHAIELLNDL